MVELKFVLEEWHIWHQSALNDENEDLSRVAVVSALGDRQDQGERKSFTGKNLEDCKNCREIRISKY